MTMENYYVKNCRLGDSQPGANKEKWWGCSVDRTDANGVAQRRKATQAEGIKLAGLCEKKPLGTKVAWQSRHITGDEATQDYMVGELVDGGLGHCVVKKVEARSETVPGATPEGNTHFSRGDYVIAVRWYHRYAGDPTGRTWVKDPYDGDKYDVLNSTELRKIGLELEEVTPPPPVQPVVTRRRTRNQASAPVPPAEEIIHYVMSEATAGEILKANW